jgi:hypothetical protein
MGHPMLTLLPIGILFCAGGVFLFHKNAFEEDRSIVLPVLVILAGVVLIALAFARQYGLVK